MVLGASFRPNSPNRASAAAEARTASAAPAPDGPLDTSIPDSSVIDDASFFTYGDGTVNDTDSDDDDDDINTEVTVTGDADSEVDVEVPSSSTNTIDTGGYVDIRKKKNNLSTPILLNQVDSFTGIRNQILHHSQVMRQEQEQREHQREERQQQASSSDDDDEDEENPNSSLADDNTFDYTFDEETAMSLTNDGGDDEDGEDGNSTVVSEIYAPTYFTAASGISSQGGGGGSSYHADSYFTSQPSGISSQGGYNADSYFGSQHPPESAMSTETNTNTAANMLMTTADLAAEIMASSTTTASPPQASASHKKSGRKSSSRKKSAATPVAHADKHHPHGAQFVVDQLEADTSKDTSLLSTARITKTYKPWIARHKRIVLVLVLLCIVVAAAVGIVVALEKRDDNNTPTSSTTNPATTAFPPGTGDNGPSLFDRDDSGDDNDEPGGSSSTPTAPTTPSNNNNNNTTPPIVPVLQEQDDMTMFPAALMATGIMDDPEKEYTILAPTDTAMTTGGSAVGDGSTVSTLAMPVGIISPNNNNLETTLPILMNKLMSDPAWSLHLRHLMLHHIVDNERLTMDDLVTRAAVEGTTTNILTMASGETVAIDEDTSAVGGDDEQVVPTIVMDGSVTVDATANNLQAAADGNDNVVAHVIDGLLRPEFLSHSVLDVTTGLREEEGEDDSMFSVLLIASGLGAELYERLDANFTLFAPTNQAFQSVDARTMSFLQSTKGRDLLIETMQQHIAPVVLPTTTTTQMVTTIAGTTLHPAYDSMGHISSVNGAALVTTNALALNGIVHTIDTVLLPDSAIGICDFFQCPANSEPNTGLTCHVDVDDCDCLEGFQKQDDECVFCSYVCPANSRPITEGLDCYSSMDDCQCDEGFSKRGDECVFCSYACPANSRPITEGLDCYSSFDDCQCDEGFLKQGDECVFCSYVCPANSRRVIEGLDCYTSIDNCVCDEGFSKQGEECVFCSYVCPANSTAISNDQQCYSSFDDCQCDEGFSKQGEECALIPTGPACEYTCPINAYPKAGLSCATGFQDCDCAEGFTKQGQECVVIQPDCSYVFRCPGNSTPKAGRPCYVDINDCQCNDGFVLEGDSCVLAPTSETPKICDYRCPAFSWRLRDRDCWSSFDDCRCAPTYFKQAERCVYKGQAPHRNQTSEGWVNGDDYYPF